ncbi:MAG: hypothetical protein M3P10_01310 [Actinomycetota bacterium]|nr:hypothetical protein [Actinomycetota bacterium]
MSGDPWTLDPDAEREILLTWRQREPDHDVQAKVLLYLADLMRDPWRPALEDPDHPGVFSLDSVPGTQVGLIWTMNVEHRRIVLAHVG